MLYCVVGTMGIDHKTLNGDEVFLMVNGPVLYPTGSRKKSGLRVQALIEGEGKTSFSLWN